MPDNVNCVSVTSADEMYDKMMELSPDADIVVKAAAVADYKPEQIADNKIKKGGMESIKLAPNRDILSELGRRYGGSKILVGFCMETENLLENAERKLKNKNLDMIVANSLNEEGAGFKTETNIVTIIDKKGNTEKTELCSKFDIANIILDRIAKNDC